MKTEIEKTLKAKYNEEFVVHDQYFDKSLNLYVFEASPKNEEQIRFEGNFDERASSKNDRIDHDAYPNEKFSHEAGEYYESLFPNKQLKHYASASVNTNYHHEFGNLVPAWDAYVKDRGSQSTIRMNTYFFEIPDRPFHQIVVTLRAILEELQIKYENNFSLYSGFWPEGFLEDKNLEELSFGFNSTSDQDADNLINKMQYLEKVLFIKIIGGSVEDIDEQKLFNLIKDDNKNGLNEMTEL